MMKGMSLNSRKMRRYSFPTHEEKIMKIVFWASFFEDSPNMDIYDLVY
jgi:hypothetical protein